ncbi:MAG: 1,4-alpha-glucan branching protein GlgB [Pseudomonadota bacterium]
MPSPTHPPHLSEEDVRALLDARHSDPFAKLGVHKTGRTSWLVTLLPGAEAVSATVGKKTVDLADLGGGLFAAQVPTSKSRAKLTAVNFSGGAAFEDAYSFGPVLGDMDIHLISEGTHRRLWDALGAHVMEHEGVRGTHFAVWAPNATRVSVVGEFCGWDGRRLPMRRRGASGVWEIFVPGVGDGAFYKYEIAPAEGGFHAKSDPFGFGSQHPPETASVVRDIAGYGWKDGDWMAGRATKNERSAPISIYEVHLPSWRRAEGGRPKSYKELATELVDYAKEMGFTHLEFLPVSEFPFDGSWGYQPIGLYAPTIRMGPPHEFRDLVEAAHQAGLGVILDWVPGHFPTDAHGLSMFDGTHLYEHSDPREGFHQDWNTAIFNYGRTEVKNYLTANALYWLEEYHVDGLRVDAVASMLYRDYSREAGQWIPNKDGGRENYEAIDFLKEMNTLAYGEVEGILTAAEESTAFGGVSAPVDAGGLGFGYKWNMGWMNDTLRYIEKDPIYRQYDHHLITFPLDWAYTENFILPISHDEVVHGKGSMIDKMPGNEWEKFANLRAYYGYMWGFPGKKLLFMGCEFGQWQEWNHDESLDWDALLGANQKGLQTLVKDLNRVYTSTPALHAQDCEPAGFTWLDNDPAQSLTAWARFGGGETCIVVCNFTPMERHGVRIAAPSKGHYREILNTDASAYGGGDRGNGGGVHTQDVAQSGQDQSIEITVPPLSTLIFKLD